MTVSRLLITVPQFDADLYSLRLLLREFVSTPARLETLLTFTVQMRELQQPVRDSSEW